MNKTEKTYASLCEDIRISLQKNIFTLPSELEMCRRYDVSRLTLRKALALLKEENVITARQGSGYALTGLNPGRANRIVLLVESDEAYLFPSMIRELSRVFGRLRYEVAVIATGADTQRERSALNSLTQAPPRGLFAWAHRSALPSPNADLYHQLAVRGTSIVFPAGRCPNISAGKTAPADNQRGGELLTEHLIAEGHTAIGMLLMEDDAIGQERYLGYCRAMTRHGLPISDRFIFKIPAIRMDQIRHDHSDRFLSGMLSFLPRGMTGMICQNDELAFMLIRALESRNIRVPDQMSVCSFDGSHLRTAGRVSLTTLRSGPQSDAQRAAALMHELLCPGTGRVEKPDWILIRGGSSGRV